MILGDKGKLDFDFDGSLLQSGGSPLKIFILLTGIPKGIYLTQEYNSQMPGFLLFCNSLIRKYLFVCLEHYYALLA